jgi:hypothetical protein
MTRAGALRCNAYHEAGHIVVGRLLGFEFSEAMLNADPYEGARISISKCSGRADDDIVMTLAGPLAEFFFRRDVMRLDVDMSEVGAASDYNQIARILRRRKKNSNIASFVKQTSALLHLHWSEVMRVANLLLERRYLTVAEL